MNFKEFKPVYIETCNKIIEENGKCVSFSCTKCPFSYTNQINNLGCLENGYNDGTEEDCEQEVLLNSAKEYLKLIKRKEMTKNDLKDGMIVELRNGDKRLILLNKFYKLTGEKIVNADSFENNLKHNKYKNLDIIKVYNTEGYNLTNIFFQDNLTLIWERKEKSESEINLEKIQIQIEKLNKSVEEFKNEVTKLVCQNIERSINDYIRRND